MTTVPGSIGWPVTGDKTIEFAKNPNEFVQNKIDTLGCRIFQTRALNRAHVFVASSNGVKEILQGKIYNKEEMEGEKGAEDDKADGKEEAKGEGNVMKFQNILQHNTWMNYQLNNILIKKAFKKLQFRCNTSAKNLKH